MDLDILKQVLKNQPTFRYKQCYKAIFVDLVSDWNEVTNLPGNLRNELNEECPLSIRSEIFESSDKNTVKALIELEDSSNIETVLMRHYDRNTVCVSSQVGCPLNCKFCATGANGFKRNLTMDEILIQVLFFARYLKKYNKKITNIVFMGMGEPFLNYDNVLKAIRIINDKDYLGLGARHISISTSGVIDGIKKLSNENLQVNLAISLHATNDRLRSELMPINKKYNLSKLFEAVDNYIDKTSRKVMFEYMMIANVNDSRKDAEELSKLMKRKLYFLNLIPYNSTGIFRASSQEKIEEFKNILEKNRITLSERYKHGKDIKGACGQLAGKR